MKIILGVFGESFNKLMTKHNAVEYWEKDWLKINEKHPTCPFDSFVVANVCYNLDVCDSCIFDVTHLKLPFNENVITLKELHIVIHNKEYFNKTTFYVNLQPINKNKLKELFIINEPIEFKDYAELLNQN